MDHYLKLFAPIKIEKENESNLDQNNSDTSKLSNKFDFFKYALKISKAFKTN